MKHFFLVITGLGSTYYYMTHNDIEGAKGTLKEHVSSWGVNAGTKVLKCDVSLRDKSIQTMLDEGLEMRWKHDFLKFEIY